MSSTGTMLCCPSISSTSQPPSVHPTPSPVPEHALAKLLYRHLRSLHKRCMRTEPTHNSP